MPRTGPFRLDVSLLTGDAAEQGGPHIDVPLTSSAVVGYTVHLRCTLTSAVHLRVSTRGFLTAGRWRACADRNRDKVRKDPCWQHRAAPPPRILVPAACPSRGSTNPLRFPICWPCRPSRS